ECAAAMSSSGLVLPLGSSVRAGQETSNVPLPDDSSVTWPLPVKRSPSQWALAVRVADMNTPSVEVVLPLPPFREGTGLARAADRRRSGLDRGPECVEHVLPVGGELLGLLRGLVAVLGQGELGP